MVRIYRFSEAFSTLYLLFVEFFLIEKMAVVVFVFDNKKGREFGVFVMSTKRNEWMRVSWEIAGRMKADPENGREIAGRLLGENAAEIGECKKKHDRTVGDCIFRGKMRAFSP